MSIHEDALRDLANNGYPFCDEVADELADSYRAYALLFSANSQLRKELAAALEELARLKAPVEVAGNVMKFEEWWNREVDHEGFRGPYDAAKRAYRAGYEAALDEVAKVWIPVTERLPEDHKPMQQWLVCNADAVLPNVRSCSTHPDWWNHKDERGHEFDGPTITHWMAAPEPPKADPALALKGK